jgi:hypothetical protein
MEAWAIFRHAVRMVFGNFGDALRVTGVPLLVPAAVIFVATLIFAAAQTPGQPQNFPAIAVVLLIIGGLGLLIGSLWSIVEWHRYVLLEERPTIAPKFLASRILTYVGKGFLVGLLMIPVSLILGLMVGGVIAASFLNSTTPAFTPQFVWKIVVVSQLTNLVVSVPLFALMYRLAPLFPAAALGIPMKVSEAWSKTSGQTGTLFGVAFLSVLALGILQIPQFAYLFSIGDKVDVAILMKNMATDNPFAAGNPFWLTAYGLLTLWLQLIVGASILTTIYGRYVEGRELPH